MEAMTVQPNARVVTHIHPPAAPGKCVVCGFGGDAEDSRIFIDFGFDIDYYGVVYFCSNCIVDVANAVGFVSGEQFTAIQKENMELSDLVEGLKNERDAASNALRAYLNGNSGISAVLESEELPAKSEPIKRPVSKKPAAKSSISSDAKESRPNDSSDSDGDTISLG